MAPYHNITSLLLQEPPPIKAEILGDERAINDGSNSVRGKKGAYLICGCVSDTHTHTHTHTPGEREMV